MKRILMSVAFVLFALPVAAAAQGSGSVSEERPPSRSVGNEIETPFVVMRSVKAKIVEIDAANGVFVVEIADGKRVQVKVDKKTRFKADKKHELGGRKKLALADFSVGDLVKITFIPSEGRIVEVRLHSERS